MDPNIFQSFKDSLKEMIEETKVSHDDYSKKSAAHKAALQVMQFEKELYYGDVSQSRHIVKIKEIIEINAEDIVNEAN
ncbi:CxC ATPase DNA modification system associated small protein [Vibrio harveyi]|jgi:hypothetical protein|uniref:CxC ATPase DNA modification system associated small protein n=1 Tax=Vibrio TaxID=662 RepID=UPI00337EC254|nr:conserved hypothetical protein [Vibrio chagasii]CAH6897595.1 conserved hypothetical protein [Vibrio chagasii]CAH6902147.1 conserved hypothetical protein [Vibrio chagasii]CAH6949626.1 conserved hypothetical protein [Vibrio chagasii]CAH7139804.1 conserved hypothetical protein [Vibrio chagasii]